MTTTLERFTQWARLHLQSQYNALLGMLSNPFELMECFDNQPGNKARGIDKISKADYAEGVVERIKVLSAKLRSLSYKPKPSRRVYILKSNGKYRPLGIPCFEDRIVQQQLSKILQAIWEPELISRLLFKWLNRRSQRRSFNWERFSKVLRGWMPSLNIRHNLYLKPLWMT
jgi:hypothetical protein